MDQALADQKAAARKAAFARRKAVKSAARDAEAAKHLLEAVLPHQGAPLAGYMPIRTEVDPLPVMSAMAAFGAVAVPVIQGEGQPLKFRRWSPGCAMIDGPFGAQIPEAGVWITPRVMIVPLVAFDRKGGRLGYGGGFYDRTLEALRAAGDVTAIGFAYAAQEAEDLPLETTDQLLDMIVTDEGMIR